AVSFMLHDAAHPPYCFAPRHVPAHRHATPRRLCMACRRQHCGHLRVCPDPPPPPPPALRAPISPPPPGGAERLFDVPASADIIDGATIRDGQPAINLSESLVRVPGLFAANRKNYAQDLQISSRGFGARATFGVRGVRLYQDFIPATMPDGQGQTGSFSLLSAERVAVVGRPF